MAIKRVLTVLGARPQFIKASVVSRAIASRGMVEETIVHTGQHYDDNMSKSFFDDLQIPEPAFNLGVGSGPHGYQTGRMLEGLEGILLGVRPDGVLVYGDTNSTLAGALAAAKLNIPVGHVEAGLRSFNRSMPEEINRIVCDHLSTHLFAPTQTAAENLLKSGIPIERIHLTGDVMFDAAIWFGQRADQNVSILHRLGLKPRQFLLATIHRAENTDDPLRLRAIMEAFCEMALHAPVVFPMHPRTRATLDRTNLLSFVSGRVCVIQPAGYLDMIVLEKNARLIATDSGGVQKEAYFYRVPCITLRDETEWVELVEAGWNRCVSPALGKDPIVEALRDWWRDFSPQPWTESLYGNGKASERVADILAEEGSTE